MISGTPLIFNIGGVQNVVTLNSRGQGKISNITAVVLSARSSKGRVLAQNARLSLTLAHSSYSSALASDGLVNGNVYSLVLVPVQILFQGTVYQTVPQLFYRGLSGKSGVARK